MERGEQQNWNLPFKAAEESSISCRWSNSDSFSRLWLVFLWITALYKFLFVSYCIVTCLLTVTTLPSRRHLRSAESVSCGLPYKLLFVIVDVWNMSANGQTTAGKDSGVGIKRCSMFAGSKETPRDLVKSKLFAGQTIPAPSDARFWPSSKNILNSIYRAHTATRYICLYCYHQLSYIGIITWPNFAVLHLYSDCVLWRLCQADDISDLLSLAVLLSPGQGPLWAVGTLQSLEPKYGTVCL